jgi:hypothetical protein
VAESKDLVTPEEAARVQEVAGQVSAVVEAGEALQVRTDEEAAAAAELLGRVKAMAKDADKARRFLVDPLTAHVRAINAMFKPNAESLAGVESAVKAKVLAFQRAQEEARAAERRRVAAENAARERAAEEERRRVAAAAQAEREAAAREAAAAQAAAERAERERLAAIEQDRESRRARISRLPEEALRRITAGGSEDAGLAQAELDARQATREAQEAAARAAEAEQAAREAEQAARSAPAQETVQLAVAEAPKLAGTASRKRWTFEVVDPGKLPAWALMPDMPEIRRRVREGLRGPVPGLRIYEEPELAVRAAR